MFVIIRKILLLVFCLFLTNASIAGETPLQNMRFFYTPEQREPAAAPPIVEKNTLVVTSPINIVQEATRPEILFAGEIRTNNKRRLFWKSGIDRYFITTPQLKGEERKDEHLQAPRKMASKE